MDSIAVEAVAALEAALNGLMPVPVPDGLTRSTRVVTQRIRPTGLGGYIGVHQDPTASLYGRRLSARVEVSIGSDSPADASAYAATLTGQVLAQTRAELASLGIHRLSSSSLADPSQLAFDVDFEYIHVPDAGEGVIDTLDVGVFNNVTPYRAKPVFDFDAATLATLPQPLAEFFAVDDPDLDGGSPAGDWAVLAAPTPRIVQREAARGGPGTLADPRKAGTQLLWRPRGVPLSLARAAMQFEFRSASGEGLGVVFGRRADDDFWFYLASQARGYQVFGRRTPTEWLQVGAAANSGFTLNQRQQLLIGFHDQTLFAELDGDRSLTVTTTDTVLAGELGLLTQGNDGATFLTGRVWRLD
jgi:hypothetical protein